MRMRTAAFTVLALVALGGLLLGVQPGREMAPPEPEDAGVAAAAAGASAAPSWLPDDRADFHLTVGWALSLGLDTIPMGDAMAIIGERFVGTPYQAHTLEEGDDLHALVNFRGLDCVTFVENVLTLARFVHQADVREVMPDRPAAEARYAQLLAEVRYRDGEPSGYPSRLHYFSDWIWDNAARGLVVDVTGDLGGRVDGEAVNFMSTHAEAYPQLAEPEYLTAIRTTEERLAAIPRYVVPQERIAQVAGEIRNGDIIAATSTVAGLDVAHTGLALWVQGELRLLHAPLSGSEVQISPVSLAERLARIDGQDGIMVARAVGR